MTEAEQVNPTTEPVRTTPQAGERLSEDDTRVWFEELMKTYGKRVGSYFLYRTGDEEGARDLVIETFFRAWRARESFRGEAKASTWLWTIARRTLAAYYENKTRRSPEVLTDEMPDMAAPEEMPVVERTTRQALLDCLETLNERVQRSAELVWVLGHSYVEAAQIMEESADSVRMRLKRARSPLQRCLTEKGIVWSQA